MPSYSAKCVSSGHRGQKDGLHGLFVQPSPSLPRSSLRHTCILVALSSKMPCESHVSPLNMHACTVDVPREPQRHSHSTGATLIIPLCQRLSPSRPACISAAIAASSALPSLTTANLSSTRLLTSCSALYTMSFSRSLLRQTTTLSRSARFAPSASTSARTFASSGLRRAAAGHDAHHDDHHGAPADDDTVTHECELRDGLRVGFGPRGGLLCCRNVAGVCVRGEAVWSQYSCWAPAYA